MEKNEQKLTPELIKRRRGSFIALIQSLAGSQGFYSRLWANIREKGVDSEAVQSWLAQFDHCTDDIDFIMALEG